MRQEDQTERTLLLKVLHTAQDYVTDFFNLSRSIEETDKEITDCLHWKEKRQTAKFYCSWKVSIVLALLCGPILFFVLAQTLWPILAGPLGYAKTYDSSSFVIVVILITLAACAVLSGLFCLIQLCLAGPRIRSFNRKWAASGVQKLNEQQAKRAHLQKEKDALVENEAAQVLGLIPPKYIYPEAIGYLIEVVENLRADTMKEAVNLYEEHLHRTRLEAAQKQIVEQQGQILQMQQENQAILNELGRSANRANASLDRIAADTDQLAFLSALNYLRKTPS